MSQRVTKPGHSTRTFKQNTHVFPDRFAAFPNALLLCSCDFSSQKLLGDKSVTNGRWSNLLAMKGFGGNDLFFSFRRRVWSHPH